MEHSNFGLSILALIFKLISFFPFPKDSYSGSSIGSLYSQFLLSESWISGLFGSLGGLAFLFLKIFSLYCFCKCSQVSNQFNSYFVIILLLRLELSHCLVLVILGVGINLISSVSILKILFTTISSC